MAGRGSLPHTQLTQTSETTPRGKRVFGPWPPCWQQQPESQSVPFARTSFRRSGVWALVTSLKLTVCLAPFSTRCYWQLLWRVWGVSLLVSTVWVIQAIAIPSYSISHCSLSSLCSSISTNHPSILLWIRGSFKTTPTLFYPAQQAPLLSVSFILESLSLIFLPSWHFAYLPVLPFTPGESQQGSKDFLGFELLTADHHPLSSSVNPMPTHFKLYILNVKTFNSFPPYTLSPDSMCQQLMTLLWPLQCKASDGEQRVSELSPKYLLCDTEYRRRYYVISFLPLDLICYSARKDAMDFHFMSNSNTLSDMMTYNTGNGTEFSPE